MCVKPRRASPNLRWPGKAAGTDAVFRWVFMLLVLLAALSFCFYLGTGQRRYRQWSLLLIKWTVVAGLAFFAVLFVGRMV